MALDFWNHLTSFKEIFKAFCCRFAVGKDVAEKEEEGGCKKCCFAFLDCMVGALVKHHSMNALRKEIENAGHNYHFHHRLLFFMLAGN